MYAHHQQFLLLLMFVQFNARTTKKERRMKMTDKHTDFSELFTELTGSIVNIQRLTCR